MSLRDEVIDAICALQGLDYHPSEKDEARIADAVVEVIQAREVQVQRLQKLVGNLIELVEELREDGVKDTGHVVMSEADVIAQENAARSMRDRAAACAEDDPTADYDIRRQILNLPLLVEESK